MKQLGFLPAALLILGIWFWLDNPQLVQSRLQTLPTGIVTISDEQKNIKATFNVEITRSEKERNLGLMYRRTLPANAGMIFLFPEPQILKFWMKNTFIPLDIIFMDTTGKIIAIVYHAKPHDETPVGPDIPGQTVLEINAGMAAKNNIAIGDSVQLAEIKGK